MGFSRRRRLREGGALKSHFRPPRCKINPLIASPTRDEMARRTSPPNRGHASITSAGRGSTDAAMRRLGPSSCSPSAAMMHPSPRNSYPGNALRLSAPGCNSCRSRRSGQARQARRHPALPRSDHRPQSCVSRRCNLLRPGRPRNVLVKQRHFASRYVFKELTPIPHHPLRRRRPTYPPRAPTSSRP